MTGRAVLCITANNAELDKKNFLRDLELEAHTRRHRMRATRPACSKIARPAVVFSENDSF